MDDVFEGLIHQNGVLLTEQENGTILTIDFSVSEYPELDLSNVGRKIDDQKDFYEGENLVCSVVK